MQNNVNTNVERIIAKLDNDFNIDHSDWIPRVGAWVHDALSELDVLRKKTKKLKIPVHSRIAYSDCPINSPNLIVTDCNGCEIDQQKASDSCNDCSSTGKLESAGELTPNTVGIFNNPNPANAPDYTVAETINRTNPERYNIHNYNYASRQVKKNYVSLDNNKLELNFDASYIYVTTEVIETEYSNTYECEFPVIPNVGLLIEAVAFYCMYKMLCRGYKHTVFNLAASQYGTNPYYEWNKLKDKAKVKVILNIQGDLIDLDGGLFRSSFFISTFG